MVKRIMFKMARNRVKAFITNIFKIKTMVPKNN
jgi:hypothetical protein